MPEASKPGGRELWVSGGRRQKYKTINCVQIQLYCEEKGTVPRRVGPSRILFSLGGNPGLLRPCRISAGLCAVVVSGEG